KTQCPDGNRNELHGRTSGPFSWKRPEAAHRTNGTPGHASGVPWADLPPDRVEEIAMNPARDLRRSIPVLALVALPALAGAAAAAPWRVEVDGGAISEYRYQSYPGTSYHESFGIAPTGNVSLGRSEGGFSWRLATGYTFYQRDLPLAHIPEDPP